MQKKAGILLLILVSLLPVARLSAQYFSLGQDPASTIWKQVNTRHFRIIYPDNFEPKAMYIADALEFVYGPLSAPLSAPPVRMPVILHNQTTYSNASVPFAPRRMEFLATPPQDNYSQEWFDQLVLHEFRHAVHYEKMRQGFTRGLYYVFGEQTFPLMLGLFVPLWFIEGDATVAETIYSRSGRGRDPAFEMKLKAQFLDKKVYHYDKAYHGSYRDFTPDVYELGYHLIAQSQKSFGRNIWSMPLDRVARKPFTLVPFSHGLHLETGLGKVKLYKELTRELEMGWQGIQDSLVTGPHENVTQPKKVFTNYQNPRFLNDSVVVAEKNPINGIPVLNLVNIRTGEEEKLITPGVRRFDETLSLSGKMMAWSERRRDPRWQMRDFAEVRIFNISTGKSEFITRGSKYFAPALSPDGSKIALVEVTEKGRHNLVILGNPGGEIITRFNFLGNPMVLTPAWSPDGQSIAAILVGPRGKRLIRMDLDRGEIATVLEDSFTEIGYPVFYGRYILFSAAYNGISNIYAIRPGKQEIWQVTSVPYGATRPDVSPGEKLLAFQNYTADGYQLAVVDIDETKWQPVSKDREFSLNLFRTYQEEGQFIFEKGRVPRKENEPAQFKRGKNLFKFHSWGPLSIDVDNQEVNPGISILSQNLLSTSFFSAGYEYNLNEEAGRVYLNYSYEGWYPMIDFRADYGRRRAYLTRENGEQLTVTWRETELGTTFRIPFDLSGGRYFRTFQPSLGVSYIHRDLDENIPVQLSFNNLVTLTYRLYYSQVSRSSRRDIFPRWGQSIDLTFRHDPFNTSGRSPASIFAAEGWVYLPSAFQNHGIRFYLGYETRTTGGLLYSSLVSLPRGMSQIPQTFNITTGKIDYVLPLFYPDWRIGPLAYIKRFKARLFFDYITNENDSRLIDYTAGLDITSDMHIFSIPAPFDMGVRFTYYPEAVYGENSLGVQFLFSFNIDNIY